MSNECEVSSDQTGSEDLETDIENDLPRVQEAVNILRSLVMEEKNLKVRMDDLFMLRYLRSSDFEPKKAFDKMVKVYKFKSKNKDYFCSEPLTEYKQLLSMNFITLLEDRNKDGCRLCLARLGDLDIEHADIVQCIKLNDIFMELALDEEETQKSGLIIILDLSGLSMRLLRWLFSKHLIKSALKEEMRPWKKLDIHVLNTSKLIHILVKFVYPFLGSSIKEHIHFHGHDLSSLHKFVDPEVLPREYGGQKSEINYEKMQKYLYDNEKELMELFSSGYINT